MKIVIPSANVYMHHPFCAGVAEPNEAAYDLEEFMERVGRTCYKSEDRITEDSSRKFIKMLYERGHHAMLEHCVASVKFVCDRGVTHELVRHRLCSFAQESTRYCNYGKDKFDNQISVIEPPGLDTPEAREAWERACLVAEEQYMNLIGMGVPPQIARSILPNCLKTEIWTTANLREWTHIFKLRCSSKAHPQIREVMMMALEVFRNEVPSMFEGLWEQYTVREES